ncbi:cell wall-binding repeat-containing protein [Clostridioides sp. GD02377]|uniref:cell wall-binding repeat-containing protein n=1 Tax=unclassified Clostridioides TaxID=2635829 RepID=UPI0038A64F2F
MKVNKRILSIGLAVTLMMAGASNINAFSGIEKIQGKDRYETSALIADKQIYDTVILVNTDNSIVDGLSASGLSGVVKAPIMLVQKDKIPTAVEKRLKDVKNAYVIGTEDTISKSVETQLKNKGIEVKRIGGEDRIKTSYLIAKEISTIKPVNKGDKVFLVNGYTGEADAMSVSSVAARDGVPVILTDGKNLDFDVQNYQCYVVGSEEIINIELAKKTNSIRIAGKDRFETNKKVIKYFYKKEKAFYITEGYKLIDAVSGAAISKENPIVLISDGSDKSILEGANKISTLGKISEKIINQCKEAIDVKDLAPTITASDIEIIKGQKFNISMMNITAKDKNGKILPIEIKGEVNSNKTGLYTLNITAQDDKKNIATKNVYVNVIVENINDPNSQDFKNMITSEVYKLINEYRMQNEKQELEKLGYLEDMASVWSRYMYEKGVYAHIIDGKNAAEVTNGMRSEENIAFISIESKNEYTSKDAKNIANDIVTLWKKSSKYKNNMLNENFNNFGFGLNISKIGDIHATIEFLN